METKPATKWRPENAQTLLWCCFCDARFESPALLSRHLDRYKVNWKLYWQLFYSSRDGKACILCNILHADRKSLECHFKMVHCITGSCAEREPEVQLARVLQLIAAEPSEESLPKPPLEESTVGDTCPGQLCPPQRESEEDPLPQAVRADNIDDIDVLFEINHANAAECATSNVTTPESLHLALPSTSSETEQSPRSRDDVQVLPINIGKLTSPRETSRNADGHAELAILDGLKSARAMSSPTFAVLQSDDEVQELESDVIDLLSPSKSKEEGEVVNFVAQTGSESCDNPEVIKIEDDDSVILVGSSQCTGSVDPTPSVDLPPTASFSAESRSARPTAVVNPFGAHGGRHSTSADRCERNTSEMLLSDGCERDIPEILPSAFLPISGPSQATTSQRSEQSNPVPTTFAPLGADLIAVVQDDADSDTDSVISTLAPSPTDPLRECRTPPHDLDDVERELGEDWQKRAACTVSRDLPDLSRLTPSKIAAFMNKDVFSAKHQSDIEKHLEEKARTEVPQLSKRSPKACSDTSSNEWEADSEGSRMSPGDTASGVRKDSMRSEQLAYDLNNGSAMKPSLNSEDEDESLPLGFSIVSVESLLPDPLVSDQVEGRGGPRLHASVSKNPRQSCEGTDKSPVTRTRRKRSLSNAPDGDAETPALSAIRQIDEEHGLSPTGMKKSRTDRHNPGEMQLTSSGYKEVFKEPMGYVRHYTRLVYLFPLFFIVSKSISYNIKCF